MKKLTKKQSKEFARIQSGILIYNCSGTEFEESNLSLEEQQILYSYMKQHSERLLRNNDETGLANTNQILDYVRKHF